MGIYQARMERHTTLFIKVPNAIVTFSNFPSNNIFKDLQKDIEQVISVSSLDERPPDYWIRLQKLFTFLESCQSVMMENILRVAPREEWKNIENQLSQLRTHTDILQRNVEFLQQNDLIEEIRENATSAGFSACQEICRLFTDENGFFYEKCFTTTPFLVAFVGVYRSFAKLWLRADHENEMTQLENVLQKYKEKCVQERLDNIKMLRTQSVSYNVHDYSHEAQIRKDVAFGGKINDFYDKRSTDNITYRDYPLNEPSEADHILDTYKNDVRREYELFFDTLL